MTGAGDNTIAHWCGELSELDGKIDTLQTAKRELFKSIREEHGRVLADSVKNALRVSRLTDQQRSQLAEIDTETVRILTIIEASRARSAPAPHARLRARVETVDEFDAETDEITEPAEPETVEAAASEDVARTPLSEANPSTAARKDVPEAEGSDAVTTASLASVGKGRTDVQPVAGTQAPPVDTQPTEAERLMEQAFGKKINPATHFRNSQGLPRLHGCQEPETCAGTWRALCATCRKIAEAA